MIDGKGDDSKVCSLGHADTQTNIGVNTDVHGVEFVLVNLRVSDKPFLLPTSKNPTRAQTDS